MRPALLLPFFCLTIGGELALVVLSGCGTQPKPVPVSPAAGTGSQTTHVGEVRVVDEQKRFVLIDLESNLSVPEPGVILRATRDTKETAKLKVSPERKRPFIAADIIKGEPKPGDEVVE